MYLEMIVKPLLYDLLGNKKVVENVAHREVILVIVLAVHDQRKTIRVY